MRIVTTLLCFLLSFLCLVAQRPAGTYGGGRGKGPTITGTIKGEVIDAATRAGVEFATVVLQSADGTKQVDGVITEADGSFKLNKVKTGSYRIVVSFLGYEDLVLDAITTTPKKPDLDLGTLELAVDAVALEAVEISGEAALVENRIDKLVYNAEKDATNTGGDASDVLRKVPLLSVDLDGNVSLRGSSNLRVLINGRPSSIFGTSLADALKTIPADQIKTVEVVTTPGAKYDGEGSGGIINIITKKTEAEGFTGTVSSSIGTRQNNGGLNLNALVGRFGFNAGVNSFWSWPREGTSTFERLEFAPGSDDVIRSLTQDGVTTNSVLGINGSAGMYYDFNAYNSVNISGRYNRFNRNNKGTTEGELFNAPLAATNIFSRFNDAENNRSGFDLIADYKHTYAEQKDRELTFALQLSGSESKNVNAALQDGDLPIYQDDINNDNDGVNLEYIAQVDYVHPVSEQLKIETGARATIRRIDSDYSTEIRNVDGEPFLVVEDLTDLFFYDQDVWAGYLSANWTLSDKWSLQTGARYELTDIRGEFDSETPDFQNDYNNLLPTIILNRKLNQFSNLKGSYTKRIQRPSLFFINPFVSVGDPNNIQLGNPNLEPETIEQYELAYNTYFKGIVFNGAFFYRRTRDLIESFLTVSDDRVGGETTYLNIGSSDNVGINFFSSVTLFKKLTIRGGVNVFQYNGTGFAAGQALTRQAYQWSGNLNAGYDFGKGLQFDAFGFARGNRQTLQGSTPSFSIFGVGLNKDFNKRFRAGIRIIEPFAENKDFNSDLAGDTFTQLSEFSIPFRSFGISASYKFGQIDFKAQRRRSKVRNDDQKEGEGNSQF